MCIRDRGSDSDGQARRQGARARVCRRPGSSGAQRSHGPALALGPSRARFGATRTQPAEGEPTNDLAHRRPRRRDCRSWERPTVSTAPGLVRPPGRGRACKRGPAEFAVARRVAPSGTSWCAFSKDQMKPAARAQRCVATPRDRSAAHGYYGCADHVPLSLKAPEETPPASGRGRLATSAPFPRRRLRGGRTGGIGRRWRCHGRADPTRASRARVGRTLGGDCAKVADRADRVAGDGSEESWRSAQREGRSAGRRPISSPGPCLSG